jgi:hypothetical protein
LAVWRLDKLKMMDNIRQGEFVEFVSNIVYELGYVWTLSYNRRE